MMMMMMMMIMMMMPSHSPSSRWCPFHHDPRLFSRYARAKTQANIVKHEFLKTFFPKSHNAKIPKFNLYLASHPGSIRERAVVDFKFC